MFNLEWIIIEIKEGTKTLFNFGIGIILLALLSPELDNISNIAIIIQSPTAERAGHIEVKSILDLHDCNSRESTTQPRPRYWSLCLNLIHIFLCPRIST